MTATISVPIKIVNGERWAELSAHGPSLTHYLCGEHFQKYQDFGFAGGHRVRRISLKKNVHWRVPEGAEYDIAGVPLPTPPRRQATRRHHK